jgi:IS605 OrfB family transposase
VRAARADFLHRVSTRLVRDHDLLVIEDLNVRGMTGNRRLAKVISDCGWGTFRDLLAYKAQRAGRRLVVIDRWYPSSKTCSACGPLLATLGRAPARGCARLAAPGTTGTTTPPRTFWRQVVPWLPVEPTSAIPGPPGCSRH